MVVETNSEKETWELGKQLAESAKPGQVFSLIGDLGVGKTVLTKGMAAGLGLLIGVPALAGGAVYGISKVVKKRRGR